MSIDWIFKFSRARLALSHGFTVVEVMITLAISGVIFAAAMSLFGGQTSETQFSASMQDLNSEITAKLKEVSTNLSYAYQQYSCSVTSVNGRLQAVLSSGSSNNDCIYLGKAIFAPQNSSTLYIYTVIGNRLTYPEGNVASASITATNFNDTNPVAAISPINLTQTYDLRSAKITASQPKNTAGTAVGDYLVGYYTDLQGGSDVGVDSNPHLLSKAYNIGTLSPPYDDSITNCIINKPGTPGVCSAQDNVAVWTICLADTGGDRTARLDVNNSPAGITTNLQFNVNCP